MSSDFQIAGSCLVWVVYWLSAILRLHEQKLAVPRKSKVNSRVWSGQVRSNGIDGRVQVGPSGIESGTRVTGGLATTAHKPTNKRRANQAVACPSWLVGGVCDERLQRVGSRGGIMIMTLRTGRERERRKEDGRNDSRDKRGDRVLLSCLAPEHPPIPLLVKLGGQRETAPVHRNSLHSTVAVRFCSCSCACHFWTRFRWAAGRPGTLHWLGNFIQMSAT